MGFGMVMSMARTYGNDKPYYIPIGSFFLRDVELYDLKDKNGFILVVKD